MVDWLIDWLIDCKNVPILPLPVSMHFAMWLCSSFYQEVESIFLTFHSGLSRVLILSRIKGWSASYKLRPQEAIQVFTFSWPPATTMWTCWAGLLEDEWPHGAEPSHPAEAILKQPALRHSIGRLKPHEQAQLKASKHNSDQRNYPANQETWEKITNGCCFRPRSLGVVWSVVPLARLALKHVISS